VAILSRRESEPSRAQWDAINRALAFSDVIAYFSARHAHEDRAEQIVGSVSFGSVVRVIRSDTSTHRLTLDGESLYNTNNIRGAWALNTGTAKMRLRMTGGCCISIGWDNDASYDNVTIRGFEVTGSGARIRWGGSYSVLEDMRVDDITSLGATVQFNSALQDGTCNFLGIDHDIKLRQNVIERGIGEGIYIAGNYNLADDGGCLVPPNDGDNHYDILIEANTVVDPGINGDEGNDIDLKAGMYNVTIRGNNLSRTHFGSGISTLGQMPASTHLSNYLVEQNVIGAVAAGYYGMSLNGLKGVVVRNNLIRNYNVGSYGSIVSQARLPGATPNAAMFQIYNNTVDLCYGMAFADMDDAPLLRNNLFLITGAFPAINYATAGIDSDYNVFAVAGPAIAEGPNSVIVPTASGIVVRRGRDDHLILGSPAIGAGINLSSSFNIDIEGTPRPLTGPWDVGAYTFVPQ
jgi:hypothetical protein